MLFKELSSFFGGSVFEFARDFHLDLFRGGGGNVN